MKNENQESNKIIAYCGLYCSNCSKYKSNKCSGCVLNNKATWCKIRSCCLEKEIFTCAECSEHSMAKQCSKFNNVFSRLIEFVTQTDRSRGIEIIKHEGLELFISKMEENGKMSLNKEKQ